MAPTKIQKEYLDDELLNDGDIGTNVQAHSVVLDATTASFTTADETKLDGIEAGADVTDSTNVLAALSGQDPVVDLITYDAAFWDDSAVGGGGVILPQFLGFAGL